MPDADMNFATFQQGHLVHAKSLRQLYAHVGKAFGISRQESDRMLSIVWGGAATLRTPESPRLSSSIRSPSDPS